MSGVAVVIPTFNRAHQIADTIRSVLAQSLPAAEIVVVDDGSTDATANVVAPFSPHVTYIRQDNAGVAAARNRGAKCTSSPLLAFVDSDDLWHRDKLAVQVAALGSEPTAGWCITGCELIDHDGRRVDGEKGFSSVFAVFSAEQLSPEELFAQYFDRRHIDSAGAEHPAWMGDAYLPLFLGNFALPSSSMIRRTVFERAGGFDPSFRLAEETEFFHRLASSAPVVILTEPLVQYRVGQAGSLISPGNTAKLIANALESLSRASGLRAGSPAAVAQLARGRQNLLRKLAYFHFSRLEGPQARLAIRELRRAGGGGLWAMGVYAASWLPGGVLTPLRRLKQHLPR
jgi:glycosyltransferase involved in cell wall biosynthesis